MRSFKAIVALVSIAFLLFPNLLFTQTSGSTFIGGTNVFVLTAPPSFCQNDNSGCFVTNGMLYVNYRNNLNTTVTGIVFMVLHNLKGQTLGFGAATLILAAGANGTAYPMMYNLPPGTYDASVFAVTPSGIAISASAPIVFTI